MGKSVDIFKIATAKTANSKRSPFLKLAELEELAGRV